MQHEKSFNEDDGKQLDNDMNVEAAGGGYFQYEEYSFLNLIMWYITQRTRITWNEVSYDELFSGIGSLIDTDYKSNATHAAPGYGLFDL